MTLRAGLIAALVIGIVAAALFWLLGRGGLRLASLYFAFQAGVCLVALVFERSRYRPSAADPRALRPTGERMIDPTSGAMVEVWEDPTTGEREYRQAST